MAKELATFAGGCFWCMVKPFDQYPGVLQVVSGYTGGHTENPTYREVCSNETGHREAVQITFDSTRIRYEELLAIYWRQIDPTNPYGQFGDRGDSYQTAIYVHDEEQRKAAEWSKQALEQSGKFARPIATEIVDAGPFYLAEEEHQDYYKKQPAHYERFAVGSGRVPYLEKVWGNENE